MVSVKDEGVGISDKDKGQLFEKFNRIPNELSTLVGGTGLGLYWAKKIIDLHRGSITVISGKSDGVTFVISVPTNQKL